MNGSLDANRFLAALTEWIEPLYGFDEARAIALMIMEKKFGTSLKQIVAGAVLQLTEKDYNGINEILKRLFLHEPIQYILGEAYFYDRWFKVNSSVLIPRPETEELCHLVINENKNSDCRILDVGTGSGCIAVILAAHLTNCELHAWDINEETLVIARENARIHHVNITFECRDIFQPVRLSKQFDIVISNPPYVTRNEMAGMRKNVLEHEPHRALFVKDNPLEYYQAIIDHEEKLVQTGGKFYFEINEAFGDEIEGLFRQSGLRSVRIIKDLHGKNRFACSEAP